MSDEDKVSQCECGYKLPMIRIEMDDQPPNLHFHTVVQCPHCRLEFEQCSLRDALSEQEYRAFQHAERAKAN